MKHTNPTFPFGEDAERSMIVAPIIDRRIFSAQIIIFGGAESSLPCAKGGGFADLPRGEDGRIEACDSAENINRANLLFQIPSPASRELPLHLQGEP